MTRRLAPGPLVAFLNRDDQWHEWAKAQMGALLLLPFGLSTVRFFRKQRTA